MHTPLLVPIKERVQLNHPASEKKTYHLALDLRGHDLQYAVGDCIGIYPTNAPELIKRTLSALKATGSETILTRDKVSLSLAAFLTHHANLVRTNKKLLRFLELEDIEIELIDLLEKKCPRPLTPQDLVDHLSPLVPRFYSIASSNEAVGPEIHLTVALTQYEIEGEKRYGCCSHYLCNNAPMGEPVIPIYLQKAKDFTLSEESFSKPIIMVGPGTGVAPFRGFMQERVKRGCKNNWLFFGERHASFDFYYKDFWQTLQKDGFLKLDTAFSRDQPEKIYVQHLMEQKGKDLFAWLQQGATLFVCGDASRMAKDVEQTLLKIIGQEGNLTPEAAKEWLKELRKAKRYLRDVY